MDWLSGMTITADRLNDFTALQETTATGATAATGWSLTTFSGRRKSGIVTVFLILNRTGAAIAENGAGSGNVSPEVDVCTLPSAWCPPEPIPSIASNGTVAGDVVINTNGLCQLRTITGSAGYANNTNLRFTGVWIDD